MENKDLWKETKELNRDYYSYEINNQIFVLFPLKINETINATGLIVPIIPLGKNFDRSREKLEIIFGFGGGFAEFNSPLESETIEVFVNGKKIKLNEIEVISLKNQVPKPNTYFNLRNYPNYVEFKLVLPILCSEVENVEIGFSSSKLGFMVPTFKYQKKSGLWSEFILSPGP
jgi:hypothetical protein